MPYRMMARDANIHCQSLPVIRSGMRSRVDVYLHSSTALCTVTLRSEANVHVNIFRVDDRCGYYSKILTVLVRLLRGDFELWS